MTRIKICGITNSEDARAAIQAGADALGFNFYEPSPRYLTPETCADIVSKMPPFVSPIGIFVNESVDEKERLDGQGTPRATCGTALTEVRL